MNKAQRLIIAIIIPFILGISGFGFISTFMGEEKQWHDSFKAGNLTIPSGYKVTEKATQWDDFEKTWGIWLTLLIFTGVIELYLFNLKVK